LVTSLLLALSGGVPARVLSFDSPVQLELTIALPSAGATRHTADVNLNPNRVPLAYRVTLYHPPDAPYVVRVRVFGNYE
jgi:hypothetical protein